MDDDLVLLRITDVRVAVPAGNGVEAGLVELEEAVPPNRRLRVYVGQPEARAIQVSWSKTVPPRPSTWDLFVSTIALLDARIDRVVIDDVHEERHYFAHMIVHRADVDDPLVLTARPSDAIALALRAYGAKIFANPHVLDEAGLLADGSHWVRPRLDAGSVEPGPAVDADAGVVGADGAEAGWLGGPGAAPVGPDAADPLEADQGAAERVVAERAAAAAERAAAAASARSFAGGSRPSPS